MIGLIEGSVGFNMYRYFFRVRLGNKESFLSIIVEI